MVILAQKYVFLIVVGSVLVGAPLYFAMRYLSRDPAKREPVKWFGIGFSFGILFAIFGREPVAKLLEFLEKALF